MLIKSWTMLAALAAALIALPARADVSTGVLPSMRTVAAPLGDALPLVNPAPRLAQSVLPGGSVASLMPSPSTAEADGDEVVSLRKTLVDLAMTLRHIRYVRGGRDPSTGFDCSGFVRYVFARAIGLHLPANSAAQFLAGLRVRREDMQPGDLVFFRTTGRRGRISHVGIYLDNGRFIHSPSRGQTVRVDNLADAYWARHFAGARRPEGIAATDPVPGKG